MPDFDDEYLMSEALREFRTEALPLVAPAGAEAVRRTVRRRRRNRIAGLALIVAVLVVAPVAAFASIDQRRPPTPATSPTPASPSPVGSPSASPSSARPSAAPPAPDAPTDLSGATLKLESWGAGYDACPSGTIHFTGRSFETPTSVKLTITATTAVDVDHDGGTETVATITCDVSNAGREQIVAVKARAGGGLTTMGTVMPESHNDAAVLDVSPESGGRIAVKVADIALCCDTPAAMQLTQVRTFAWSGTAFHQTDGPSGFAANPYVAKVTVRPTQVAMSPPSGGVRSGTLTLTVRNDGPQPAAQASVMIEFRPYFDAADAGSWSRCTPAIRSETNGATVCQLGTIAVGASVTLTLPVTTTITSPGDATSWDILVQPRMRDQEYQLTRVPMTFG